MLWITGAKWRAEDRTYWKLCYPWHINLVPFTLYLQLIDYCKAEYLKSNSISVQSLLVVSQVNGEDLSTATHSRAVLALRHTLNDSLNLLVLRGDMAWNDQDLHDVLTVELVKKPSKGLGLSIVSRRRNTGIVIADIVSSVWQYCPHIDFHSTLNPAPIWLCLFC